MLAMITLLVALSAQIGLLIYRITTKSRQAKVTHVVRLASFAIFSLLLATGVYWWGFRWMGLLIALTILAMLSGLYFIKKPRAEKPYRKGRAILSCVNGCIMLTFLILPGIIFPQFKPVAPTGPYGVDTASVTVVDESRVEPFSETGENRKLTVQFWYPNVEAGKDSYPLLIFSHGSFGYRGSNLSTFEDLASNGYVVCSIDHSYHAFFARHTDGSTTLVNTEFLNDAVNITNGAYDAPTTYQKTHDWLALRAADMDFVMGEIVNNPEREVPARVHSMIDAEKIGLFGHSLGGAAAAQLGRDRSDVDSVAVIDGTMIGEEIALENGQSVLNTASYPVPLLNLYNETHYADAMAAGGSYNNLSASSHAAEAYDVVIRGSGHLNFTDLALFSPTLARMLGVGEVDSRYCIETMNHIVLDFFNATLKNSGTLDLHTEY